MIISMNSWCVAQPFYKLGLIPILDFKLASCRCLAVVAVALNVNFLPKRFSQGS